MLSIVFLFLLDKLIGLLFEIRFLQQTKLTQMMRKVLLLKT